MLAFLFWGILANILVWTIVFKYGPMLLEASSNKLPSLEEFEKQEAQDAWTRIGEHEVELFLAPHTTPDDDGIVWPDSEQTKLLERTKEDAASTSL